MKVTSLSQIIESKLELNLVSYVCIKLLHFFTLNVKATYVSLVGMIVECK